MLFAHTQSIISCNHSSYLLPYHVQCVGLFMYIIILKMQLRTPMELVNRPLGIDTSGQTSPFIYGLKFTK